MLWSNPCETNSSTVPFTMRNKVDGNNRVNFVETNCCNNIVFNDFLNSALEMGLTGEVRWAYLDLSRLT